MEEKLPELEDVVGDAKEIIQEEFRDESDDYKFYSIYNDFATLLELMNTTGMSEYDAKCFLAKKIIEEFLSDPDILEIYKEKQKDYIHSKGWSANRTFREEYSIPQEAWSVLPVEIRDNQKVLLMWLKENARCLVFS